MDYKPARARTCASLLPLPMTKEWGEGKSVPRYFKWVSLPRRRSSRSEAVTVAVGFSPRSDATSSIVAERGSNKRRDFLQPSGVATRRTPAFRRPWAKAHGYRHLVAPRPEGPRRVSVHREQGGTENLANTAQTKLCPTPVFVQPLEVEWQAVDGFRGIEGRLPSIPKHLMIYDRNKRNS